MKLILLIVSIPMLNSYGQDVSFNSYSGQQEISSTGSITLTSGFHVPAGQNLRVFIANIASQSLASTPSANQNYIITNTYQKAYTTPPSNPTTADVIQEVEYFDGLGRPLQHITTKGSPSFKDVVLPVEYDGFGRESKKYLPYSATGTAGSFRPSAATAQATFYNAPPTGVPTSAHPYSVTVFENSPLNRVLEQGAPGNFWQPSNNGITGSGHTIKTEFTTNNQTAFTDIANTKRVALYGVNLAADGTPSLKLNGVYGAGQLYVYVTKDENWKPADGRAGTSEEYVDKEGRTVLKRTFNKKYDSSVEMLSTYFVFNDFGDLTYVLPPGRTGEFDPDTGTLPTSAQLNNFCYQYRFDGRRRMVEKRLPGKDVEYLVYNKNDQVVLTQNAIQRAKSPKEWTFTKYDAFGRVVMTGRYITTLSNRTDLQGLVDVHTPLWEDPHATNATRYTNTSFPNGNGAEVYSFVYYDDYDLPTDCPAAWRTLASSYTPMTKTLQTATKTKIIGSTDYLWDVNYYDDRGRVVRTNSQHHHGGTDITVNTYDFPGRVTSMTRTHSKGSTSTTVKERYEYDHQGRLVNTYHQVNTQPEVLLASNTYDEVGMLLTKELHSEDEGSTYLQKLDHRYNIRGWLTSINGTSLNTTENDLFGLEIKYTDEDRLLGVHPGYYNGNIAEVIWNTGRTNKPRAYAFQYDNLNRLLSADYRAHHGNWTTDTENGRFTEGGLAYDKMGNIQQLKRFGTTGTASFGAMDDLEYTYTGNRLLKVNEKATGNRSYGFKEPTPTGANEYTYDVNGNLKTDINKGITAVNYNYLNLPEQVSIGGNNISYLYTAEGTKLRKTVGTNVTHYIHGIHYNGDQIHFIQTAEGRVLRSPSTGQYTYEYHLKDHQNNVRVAFDKNTSTGKARIIQEDSYYPFGMVFNSYSYGDKNNYLFQGQEIQSEYGLDWSHFKWRMHDAAIGRFISIDPLATEYTHNSPYAFSENRVINGVELEGLEYMTTGYSYNAKGMAQIMATSQKSTMTEMQRNEKASMEIDMIPFVGDAKGFVEAFTGRDMVSGDRLSGVNRALGLIFLSELRVVGKVGDVVSNASRVLATGKWVETAESMSKAAASYQKQITGVDAGKSFKLNGVKFDGVTNNGVLKDAKSGMENFVDGKGGFKSFFGGQEKIIKQANSQIKAANGTKIQWHFENKDVLDSYQKLLEDNNIKGIDLVHTPRQ
ncbi:DUF6443 domain-containing protein [Sphingobacterium hotanense]|uniref:DUF6443 domain-containing protein n=1 Tax=Sphingobacterium hotanense TaxID=649196 RepID=UPI0021A2C372|nr:DUF6443 domain-containing protein [Sphingobacterium hotanense]MCT1526442.1 DUF6443 domain-containing protein [Sphingobacterium hotanense]